MANENLYLLKKFDNNGKIIEVTDEMVDEVKTSILTQNMDHLETCHDFFENLQGVRNFILDLQDFEKELVEVAKLQEPKELERWEKLWKALGCFDPRKP
jgi:hypothetical protein